jgi:hypothetical protein
VLARAAASRPTGEAPPGPGTELEPGGRRSRTAATPLTDVRAGHVQAHLAAKPVIDLDVVVRSEGDLPKMIGRLQGLGYSAGRRLAIPGFNALTWPTGEQRPLRVVAGSTHHRQRIAFRDHLRSHPDDACRYADIKRDLAHQFECDWDSYARAKNEFVEEILAAALAAQLRRTRFPVSCAAGHLERHAQHRHATKAQEPISPTTNRRPVVVGSALVGASSVQVLQEFMCCQFDLLVLPLAAR